MDVVISLVILGFMAYVVYHQYGEQEIKYLEKIKRKEKWKN